MRVDWSLPDLERYERLALGVDPGTARMGYGVVGQMQDKLRLLDYGVLVTSSDSPLPTRLQRLYDGLVELIQRRRPAEMAVEELFFSKNARTALAVGQARGVAMLAAAHCGLPVSEYTPLAIKQAVAGYGRARKDQIQQMVRVILDLQVIPEPDDAADALAVAICHLQSSRVARLIEAYADDPSREQTSAMLGEKQV